MWADVDDAGDWLASLLDSTLERVDDAVVAARVGPTAAATAAAAAGDGVGGTIARAAAAAAAAAGLAASGRGGGGRGGGAAGGFISYMEPSAQAAARPQERFEDAVDNSRTPFEHKLDSLAGVVDVEAAAAAADAAAMAGEPRPHPLAAHLEALQYPGWQLEVGEAQPPKSDEETPFTYVDTVPALRAAGELACLPPCCAVGG